MAFSVGIGLTNECDLRCAHCYRPDAAVDRLAVADVRRLVARIPIRSLNLGVGENGLHPDYEAILDLVWARGITTSITSNGLSIQALPDAAVQRFLQQDMREKVSYQESLDALQAVAGEGAA